MIKAGNEKHRAEKLVSNLKLTSDFGKLFCEGKNIRIYEVVRAVNRLINLNHTIDWFKYYLRNDGLL